MALVIWRVLSTLLMRVLIAFMDAMARPLIARRGGAGGNRLAQELLGLLRQVARGADALGNSRTLDGQVLEQVALEIGDPVDGHLGQQVMDDGIDDADLKRNVDRAVAVLLQHLNDALALRQTRLGVGVEIGAELGEGLQLAVLRVHQLQGRGDLFSSP